MLLLGFCDHASSILSARQSTCCVIELKKCKKLVHRNRGLNLIRILYQNTQAYRIYKQK